MVDRKHELPMECRAELPAISRVADYYNPEPVSEAELRLMRRIDELRPEDPFAGRMMLREKANERANKALAMDITYFPMARGWMYVLAVLDWQSRRTLAYRVSITMEADFRVGTLNEAVAQYGAPQIDNIDEGRQFGSAEFVNAVKACASMYCVFVERLLCSGKCEGVSLRAYDSGGAA